MAVELRCPKCKTKLRLPDDLEEDAEIECPKCEHAFTAAGNIVRPGGDDEKPAKKKPARDEEADEEKPKKKDDKKTDKEGEKKNDKKANDKKDNKKTDKPAGQPKKRKKKKSKKRETNPLVWVGIAVGGLMVLGFFGVVLYYFYGKKPASQEMMTYLPDDCDQVSGINLGHLTKYVEFYKGVDPAIAPYGFKKAADVFSKTLGSETKDAIDYVVQGTGGSGEATVLRTKAEFDQGLVAKIPGAQKGGNANGVDYYTVPDPGLGYPLTRVFSPTNRLVVFCRGDIPDSKFRAMVTGNKDNLEGTPFKRAGVLGKQVVRGTAWRFTIYGKTFRPEPAPTPPTTGGSGGGATTELGEEDQLKKQISEILSGAQGTGIKASVGSREVRGEWLIWYKDSETASGAVKKWKEQEWVKDDEKSPPRYWKTLAQKTGFGKTAENVIRDGLAFRSSKELFIIRNAADTKLIQQPGTLLGAFTGTGQNSGPTMTPGGPGGPPGGPPNPVPGGPTPGVPPKP